MAKQLNVQQVKKLGVTSKLERSTADQSPYDEKTAAYCQKHNESSLKADEVKLEIEGLKEVVEKWKNKYRILKQTVSNFKREIKTAGDYIPNEIRTYIIYLKHDNMLFDSETIYLAFLINTLSVKNRENCNILTCCMTGLYPDNNVT